MLSAFFFLLAAHQWTPVNPEWNRPVEPFRIAGNLYYVGAAGISAYLLTSPDGDVLLDSGFQETVPLIEANMHKLGFRLTDVRILINSHAHVDHAGGLAELKSRTKARLLASPADAELMVHGGKGDFAFGDTLPYQPVVPDALLKDGEPVRLGNISLTPHFTPGHTKGCTTWTTTVQDGGHAYRVVFTCSLTAPGYQLTNNPKYPLIWQDFEASLKTLRALPCDIFLAPHGWDFNLADKSKALGGAANPFVDPDGYRRYLDRSEAALHKQAGLPPKP